MESFIFSTATGPNSREAEEDISTAADAESSAVPAVLQYFRWRPKFTTGVECAENPNRPRGRYGSHQWRFLLQLLLDAAARYLHAELGSYEPVFRKKADGKEEREDAPWRITKIASNGLLFDVVGLART